MQPGDPNRPPKYSNEDIFGKAVGGGQRNEHIGFDGRDTSWRSIGVQLGLVALVVVVLVVAFLLF